MREYRGSEIRNIAVVGHGASGKTSLVDALAFVSGSSKRHGSVRDGTALTDTAPEEIERGYSINLGVAFAEWMGTKINIIDTPGFSDFQGDATAGLAAADGALCVVSATAGVEVGTERMFREAMRRKDPVLFVVSMMDKDHADFDRIYEQVKTRLSAKVIPVEIPLGEGPDFHGVANLFTKKALLFKRGSKGGEYQEVDIPADYRSQFDRYYQELLESISSTDDSLLERYLEGGEITREEMIVGMKEAMKRMELFPLFCASSELNYGMQAVLTTIVELMPTAWEMEEVHAFKGAEGNRTVEIHADENAPFAALVFKTMSEPHVGDVSFFRIFAGSIVNGQEVFNATRDTAEKLNTSPCRRGRSGSRLPASVPVTSAAWRSSAARTPTTRCPHVSIRCGFRRFSSPSRSSTWPSTRRRARTRRSFRLGCTSCTRRIPPSRRTTTRRPTRPSSPASASGTSRSRSRA